MNRIAQSRRFASSLATSLAAILLTASLLPAQRALQRGQEIEPLEQWRGKVNDEAQKAAAPAGGVITTQAQWQSLWKAWRGEEALPEVNFATQFIYVEAVDGPNNVGASVTLGKEGDLRVICMSTMMAGPGFGYVIVKLDRQNVKTVNDKPLPAPPASQPATAPAGATR